MFNLCFQCYQYTLANKLISVLEKFPHPYKHMHACFHIRLCSYACLYTIKPNLTCRFNESSKCCWFVLLTFFCILVFSFQSNFLSCSCLNELSLKRQQILLPKRVGEAKKAKSQMHWSLLYQCVTIQNTIDFAFISFSWYFFSFFYLACDNAQHTQNTHTFVVWIVLCMTLTFEQKGG